MLVISFPHLVEIYNLKSNALGGGGKDGRGVISLEMHTFIHFNHSVLGKSNVTLLQLFSCLDLHERS